MTPLTVTREIVTRETATATLYGCQWAILPGTALPPAMDAILHGERAPWYALRLSADRRYIAGHPAAGETAAREWAEADQHILLEAEQDHYQRTGTLPPPMTPALPDAPVIAS